MRKAQVIKVTHHGSERNQGGLIGLYSHVQSDTREPWSEESTPW